jgi:hypothetical protein
MSFLLLLCLLFNKIGEEGGTGSAWKKRGQGWEGGGWGKKWAKQCMHIWINEFLKRKINTVYLTSTHTHSVNILNGINVILVLTHSFNQGVPDTSNHKWVLTLHFKKMGLYFFSLSKQIFKSYHRHICQGSEEMGTHMCWYAHESMHTFFKSRIQVKYMITNE